MSHQRWRTFRRGMHRTRWTRTPTLCQVGIRSRNSHRSSDTCQPGRMSRNSSQRWTAFRRNSARRRPHSRSPKRCQQGKESTDQFRNRNMPQEGRLHKRLHMNSLPSQLGRVSTWSCHWWWKPFRPRKGYTWVPCLRRTPRGTCPLHSRSRHCCCRRCRCFPSHRIHPWW